MRKSIHAYLRALRFTLQGLKIANLLPELRRILISVSPLLFWVLLFAYITPSIPADQRPPIRATLLPSIEKALFFGVCSYQLVSPAVECSTWLRDVAAAFIYGIHFMGPLLFCLFLWFITRKVDSIYPYLWCFGIMNSFAVSTQFLLPTAPPWWIEKYLHQGPPTYDVKGEPAGLACFDRALQSSTGLQFFTPIYSQSPVVFGAFPSLHAAWPFMMALFCSPFNFGIRVGAWIYVAWVCWAAMHLRHHFLLDLLGGGLYAYCSYVFFHSVHTRLVHGQKSNSYKVVELDV